LLTIGLTISQITLINVFFWGTILILEVPTGLFADRLSRRLSVSCGAAFTAIGFASYAFVQGFWTAFVSELLVGVGGAFISGALSAWLTDALRHRGEGHKLRRAFATGALANSIALVVGGFASSFLLASTFPRFCWGLGAVFAAGSFFATRFAMKEEGNPVVRVRSRQAWRESVGSLKQNRSLKWSSIAAMAMGLVVPFNLYWAPLAKEQAGNHGMAWTWAIMYGAMAVANWAIRRSKAPAGRETAVIMTALVMTGLGLVFLRGAVGFVPLLVFVVLHESGRGLFAPVLDSYTQQHLEEHYRATYSSLQSLLGKVCYVGVLVVATAVTWGKEATIPVMTGMLSISGVGILLSVAILWVFRPKSALP
jgi:MFS family permease